MVNLVNKAQDFKITRRSFIGWTTALAAAAAIPVSRGLVVKAEENIGLEAAGGKGVWKTVACWHNCGGRCLNKALVKDGVVVRQKTDDTHEDTPDFPQQRGCLRGRSQRHQVFSADRLKYPMKRKNWAPGGGNKALRGKDQWVRISWDEAIEHIASETTRIRKKYGNESIWVTGGGDISKVMSHTGGHTVNTGPTSYGAWLYTHNLIGVSEGIAVNGINDRMDLRNSQLIVLWGANPAWSSLGNATYHYLQAKKAGARFISIDPMYTDTNNVLDAEWIPVRPGTDHALALGMMYTLLDEDDPKTNPLVKWDFLKKYTVGFEAGNMPEGADPKDNFKDYVLGTYDNQPKTPEWASEICGVMPEAIRRLAREIGGTDRVALLTGWAPARTNNGEGWVHAFSTLGMMTGHIGSPGNMTGVSVWQYAANMGPMLINSGGDNLPGIENPVDYVINDNQIFDAVLKGEYLQKHEGTRNIDIQMIYHNYNATLQTKANIMKGIEAHRKVEFVVSHAYVLQTNAKYSDIVLPVCTEWELEGNIATGNREILIAWTKIVDPLYESKSDQEIAKLLLEAFGKDPKEVYPFDEKQQFFNKLAGCTVMKENHVDFEPLLTITAEDIKEWGVEGTPQQGRMTLKEYLDRGIYQVPRAVGDQLGCIAYKDFIDNPEKNPLTTESGKFEIYCRALHEASKTAFTEIAPIAKYEPRVEGYEATFADWDTKKKGDYPFQVFNPHYLRRSHSTFDNVGQLREAWPNPVYLNQSDATKLGIKDGETVLLSNQYGKTLRPAKVVESIMPGTIALPHGAWVDLDEEEKMDRAGADNVLVGHIPTGLGTSGYNTAVCNVEKWDGAQLEEDYKWAQRIVDYK